VAEDVEKVDPALLVRDKEGKPYSVRYDQVNAMLLNEFLKEHGKVEKQQAMISELQSSLASQGKNFEVTTTKQQKEIEALTVGLQKVSAQVGVSALGAKVIATKQTTGKGRNGRYESAD
jgi:biotin-(acetyl-CoA carboxylase) ligase